MRVWTIQPLRVWEQVEEGGVAVVDPGLRPAPVQPSFEWLVEQLRGRLEGYEGNLPWWAYCSKPDLRVYRRGSLPGGPQQVRLELEVPTGRNVSFPIWAWNVVFLLRYLGTRKAQKDWRRRRKEAGLLDVSFYDLPHEWRQEIEESWPLLFTRLPRRKNARGRWGGREAVFEKILLADVRKVEHFTIRPRLGEPIFS